jgi:hypothetical protein
MPPDRSTCWCSPTSVPTSDHSHDDGSHDDGSHDNGSHDNGSHDNGSHEPVGQQRLARQRFAPAGSDGKGSNGSRTATARLGRSAGKGSHGPSGEPLGPADRTAAPRTTATTANRSGEAAQAPASRPIHQRPPIPAKRRRRPQTRSHRPPARSPAKERRISPKTPCAPDLSTGLHRQARLSHKVVPSDAHNPTAAPNPVDNRITPAHQGRNHTRRPMTMQDRVSETAHPHLPVIPRRSTHHPTKRPESRSTTNPLCQRQDGTVSCQRYPHQFTGLHRLLSPAVDKARTRTPQMWIKPGEIDVDRHDELRSCPPPVDGCGFPVEGSGDDGPVASQRCPHLGGQTPWISGG